MNCLKEHFKGERNDTHFNMCMSKCPEFCCFSFMQRRFFQKKLKEPTILENIETPIITIASKVDDDEAYVFLIYYFISINCFN